jgi:hypothetical protein
LIVTAASWFLCSCVVLFICCTSLHIGTIVSLNIAVISEFDIFLKSIYVQNFTRQELPVTFL